MIQIWQFSLVLHIVILGLLRYCFAMSDYEKVGEMNFKYEWTIPNFFSHFIKDSAKCRSPDFQASNTTWFIRIDPNSDVTEHSTGYLSLYLYRDVSKGPAVINFSCGIKAVDQSIVNEFKGTFGRKEKRDESLGWSKFVARSRLMDRLSKLLPSNSLTIVCSIEGKDSATDIIAAHSKLAEDFKNLLVSEEYTDVTLNVKKKTFVAHKGVLAARSPVFAAMFKNEMTEKNSGAVRISDCDGEAFGMFLLFLYSGEFDYSKCNICQLYKISEKYDIPELKIMCVNLMIENLSVDNFGETLIFSDQFREEKLLNEVQCFFNEHFEDIVTSVSWKTLFKQNFRLANNLLKGMAPKVKIVN